MQPDGYNRRLEVMNDTGSADVDAYDADRILVARICAGSEAAFADFVNTYRDRVSGYIFRLIPNDHDREEVCQDVFIKAWHGLREFRFQSALSTWLYRIAWHSAISYIRSNRTRMGLIEAQEDMSLYENEAPDSGPEREIGDQELYGLLNEEVSCLTIEEKSLLSLYHYLELGVADIGQVMSRPVGTIKSDLSRVRKKLRDRVVRRLGTQVISGEMG